MDSQKELDETYSELQRVSGSLNEISEIMSTINSLKSEAIKSLYTGSDRTDKYQHRISPNYATPTSSTTSRKVNPQIRSAPTVLLELRQQLEAKANSATEDVVTPARVKVGQRRKVFGTAEKKVQDPLANEAAKLFRPFDIDNDGTVSHEEFRLGMSSLGFRAEETSALLPVLDPENKGLIDYNCLHKVEAQPGSFSEPNPHSIEEPAPAQRSFGRKYINNLFKQENLKIQFPANKNSTQAPLSLRDQMTRNKEQMEVEVNSLRRFLPESEPGLEETARSSTNSASLKISSDGSDVERVLLNKLSKGGVGTLRVGMRRKDASHSGCLGSTELNQTFQKFGINLRPNQMMALKQRYQKEQQLPGTVDYEGMLDDLEQKLAWSDQNSNNRRAQDINKRVCRKVSEALQRFPFDATMNLFRQWDRDGNSTIDRTELDEGMRSLGTPLSGIELDALIKIADQDGDGVINYKELVYVVENQRAGFNNEERNQRFEQDQAYSAQNQASHILDYHYSAPAAVPTNGVKKERLVMKRLGDLVGSCKEELKADLTKVSLKKQGPLTLADIQKSLLKNGVQVAHSDLKKVLMEKGISGKDQIPLDDVKLKLGLDQEKSLPESLDGGIFYMNEQSAMASQTVRTSMFDTGPDWTGLRKSKPRCFTQDDINVSNFWAPTNTPEPLMAVSLTGMLRSKSCPRGLSTRGALNESSLVSEIMSHNTHKPSSQPVLAAPAKSQSRTTNKIRPPPFAVETRHEAPSSRIRIAAATDFAKSASGKGSAPSLNVSCSLAEHLQQSGISKTSTHFLKGDNSSMFHEP